MSDQLARAFCVRLDAGHIVAFVGGGGKTSLLYATASDLVRSSDSPEGFTLLTTTTKMIKPKVGVDCDAIVFCKGVSASDALGLIKQHYDALRREMQKHATIALFAEEMPGNKLSEGKPMVKGVPLSWPSEFSSDKLCRAVLVEADGSRRLPFKAPSKGKSEPAIPDGATHVIAVAGADVIGQQLSEHTVCRSLEVSLLTSTNVGEEVTLECVSSVIGSRHVWGVHESALFIACLNKADMLMLGSSEADKFVKLVESLDKADAAIVTGRDTHGGCKSGMVFKEKWTGRNSGCVGKTLPVRREIGVSSATS